MSDLRPRSVKSRKRGALARHGRLRTARPVSTVFKFCAGAAVVLLVSGASVAAIAAWDVARSMKRGVTLANETPGGQPSIGAIEGGVNLLLVGSDSRHGQPELFGNPAEEIGNLNDVTMLLHISHDHSHATVVTFPRDLVVQVPECSDPDGRKFEAVRSKKINETLSRGGLACTVATVEELTGLAIPFAAMVQFNGVIEMSNAVGGVSVCVAERIEDRETNTFLSPGDHTLSGLDALQFLRTRHGVGDGSDLGRISNQQVFLSSLVRTVKSSATLTDPLKVYGLAKAVVENTERSNSLNNVDTIISIALALKDINLDEVAFVQYPWVLQNDGNAEIVLPFEESARVLTNAVKLDQAVTLSGSTGRGSVGPGAPAPPSAAPAGQTPQPQQPPGVVLPPDVQGQTAEQRTCSKGRSLSNQ